MTTFSRKLSGITVQPPNEGMLITSIPKLSGTTIITRQMNEANMPIKCSMCLLKTFCALPYTRVAVYVYIYGNTSRRHILNVTYPMSK